MKQQQVYHPLHMERLQTASMPSLLLRLAAVLQHKNLVCMLAWLIG